MEDLQKFGGTPSVLRYLLDKGMIDGSCLTVTGKTVAENLADVKAIAPDNPIIFPIEKPIKATGHLQILYGNVAPEGWFNELMLLCTHGIAGLIKAH